LARALDLLWLGHEMRTDSSRPSTRPFVKIAPLDGPRDETNAVTNKERAQPAPERTDPSSQEGERRQSKRLPPESVPGIGSVTLHPREPAQILNISPSGLLVNCARRLRPTSAARFVLRCFDKEVVTTGRVVRCQVRSIAGDGGIAYEIALHYDRELSLDRYCVPRAEDAWMDRRSHGRARGPFEAIWLAEPGKLAIAISDLSEGGCFVRRPSDVSPGEHLSLSVRLPYRDQLLLAGEVVSIEPDRGFAVRFKQLDAAQRLALQSAVASLQPAAVKPLPGSPHRSDKTVEILINDW